MTSLSNFRRYASLRLKRISFGQLKQLGRQSLVALQRCVPPNRPGLMQGDGVNPRVSNGQPNVQGETSNAGKRDDSLRLNGISFRHLRQLSTQSHVTLQRSASESSTRPVPGNGGNRTGSVDQPNVGGETVYAGSSQCNRKRNDCVFCGKIFRSRSHSLESHMWSHTKEQHFECSVCAESFSLSGNLRRHKILLHSDRKKRLNCELCGKRYHLKHNLETHTRRHLGEKLFGCTVCGKRFVTGVELGNHKLIHSGEKPHKCNICLKTFRHKTSLDEHCRLHTAETPYKCFTCTLAFSSRVRRYYHYKATGHAKA